MSTNILSSASFVKIFAFSFAIFLSAISNSVHAVFIDFDDLTYASEDPDHPFFWETPVTDQYLSQGLMVSGGFLYPYNYSHPDELGPDDISGPNFLWGGQRLVLDFVGDELPTYVGMYVGANIEAIFLSAYSESGLLASTHTKGDGGPLYSAPYEPRQYVSFLANEGIRTIAISGFWGGRTSAHIDDLTFTYADVPEPSPFILLCIGLAILGLKRVNDRR